MGSSYSSSGGGGGGGCYIARRDGRNRRRGGSSDGIIPCKKMASSLAALRRRGRRQTGGSDDGRGRCDAENRSWLLADAAAGDGAAELHSVHSSFRLSFRGSPPPPAAVEAAGGGAAAAAAGVASAVLLLVSLEDDDDRQGAAAPPPSAPEALQWQRLDFLERSISPIASRAVRFSYAEIHSATYGFSAGRELGRGPLSRVYRGRVGVRRRAVAIKRLEGEGRESTKSFCRELMIASSLCNPNIVPLIGFCIDKAGLFLVYKFVSGGSLDRLLHHSRKVLPWTARYKVAVGAARAVEYLHYGTEKCVIHRDIKSSNILLSSKKSPKVRLCDFGFATWARGTSLPFLCKSVKGTFGYLAPEYFQHGKLSDKTDVYAFGVVLLELITGRKAIDQSRPQGDENLVLWVKEEVEVSPVESDHVGAVLLCYGGGLDTDLARPNLVDRVRAVWRNRLAGSLSSGICEIDSKPGRKVNNSGMVEDVARARPLLQQGEGAMEKLLDPRIKLDSNSSNEMSRMVHAATACLCCEDSGRPSIDQVIAILQGQGNCGGDWPIFMGHGCFVGYGSTRLHGLLEMSDVKSHLALAMLGYQETKKKKNN
ncbi:Serine/threonine-protein kinase PBS1 [Ananas comosus]|uniref:Serine/threonine-protein kinase PBS1 n=1 Tax=Ananas comosus TaxID=4615 RepID=A0A199VPI5_ANACO|nr:Serine/threonine-protein kinase PBS1 [Ananas comosus]